MPSFERVNAGLGGDTIVSVSAGHTHCAAVSVAGTLYTWGQNTGGGAGAWECARFHHSCWSRPHHDSASHITRKHQRRSPSA